jgi:ribosomal protein S24E
MELNVTNNYENKLLGRREISATATYTEKTPTKEEVKEGLCKKLSLDPALVEIREIRQQYGLRVSNITAYSYATKEVMEKLEKKRGKKPAPKEVKSGATAK